MTYSNEEQTVFAHCRDRQNEGREIEHHVARTIAAWWHCGANDTYALSSTGTIRDGLTLRDFHEGEYDRQAPDNRLALDMLGTYIVARQVAGNTGPVAGWADMWADKPAPEPQSGYTPCACRDCMDTTVSSDVTRFELCSGCKGAGCSPGIVGQADIPGYVMASMPGYMRDCQRDDAYGDDSDRSCGCGGAGVHGVDHGDYGDA